MRRPLAMLAVLAGWVGSLGGASVAAAQAPPPAPVRTARLAGAFMLAGRVTMARSVRGEHAGEHISRRWEFTSLCPSGPCTRVLLVRHRHAGTDKVILTRHGAGRYSGLGRFAAPLACDGQTYAKGNRILFKVTVRVDSAILLNGAATAARVSATYTNYARVNLTPCVAALGRDAAAYHGHLLLQ